MQKIRTESTKSDIIGVDEAGRGSWAGPIVTAACRIVDVDRFFTEYATSNLQYLNDSKKLSPSRREMLFLLLQGLLDDGIIVASIGFRSAKAIDRVGILEANRRSMGSCIRALLLRNPNSDVFVDGCDNYRFHGVHPSKVRYIIRGDGTVVQIMMASILAKVFRDNIMRQYHILFPKYGFDAHKGYGTSRHRQVLLRHGPCRIHRMTYRPLVINH